MTDFHAHILPGADHGSDSLETSLRQLALAEEAGVRCIVATPHFYPQTDDFDDFLRLREKAYDLLTNHYHGPVELRVGAEVHVCVGLEHLEGVEELCPEGSSVMLLELSRRNYPHGLDETFDALRDQGIVPLLAHVDRYDPTLITRLLSQGLLGQLNADALCRLHHRRMYFRWIDSGCIHALGSDIHGTEIGYADYLHAQKVLGARANTLQRRMRRLLEE